MSTTAAAVTLRKLDPTTVNRLGKTISLARYAVIRGGEEIGQVFQHRSTTVQRYSGKMYGYATERTWWGWHADRMGDSQMSTRKEALADLLSMVDDRG